jgi:O-antigen/teichoic acid export membrane protein
MVLVSVFFGPLLLKVLYTPEYANHSLLLLTLTVAAAVGYIGSIFGYALTAARAIHSQFVFVLVTTGTIWLLCLLLIPRFGMMGAASAILCGALIQTLGFAVVLLSVIKRLRRNQVRGEVRPGLPRSAHVVSH